MGRGVFRFARALARDFRRPATSWRGESTFFRRLSLVCLRDGFFRPRFRLERAASRRVCSLYARKHVSWSALNSTPSLRRARLLHRSVPLTLLAAAAASRRIDAARRLLRSRSRPLGAVHQCATSQGRRKRRRAENSAAARSAARLLPSQRARRRDDDG